MAIPMTAFTNPGPVNADYPSGSIKDNPGDGTGTKINAISNGDLQQFFAQLMVRSGTAYNGLPDNTTNTFQLYTALTKLMYGTWINTGVVFTNSGNNVWGNYGNPYYDFKYKIVGDEIRLCGTIQNTAGLAPTGAIIMTLPAGIRPAKDIMLTAIEDNTLGGNNRIDIYISTAGLVTSNLALQLNFPLHLDGLCYRLI